MPKNKKNLKGKKSNFSELPGFFSSSANSEGATAYCTQNQCFTNNEQNLPSTSSTSLVLLKLPRRLDVSNSTLSKEITDATTLSELLPPELSQLLITAAKRGLLSSMLLTLANEGVTDYLKSLNYRPETIYLINQSIRAFLLVSLGNSALTAVTGAFSGHILSSYCGLSKETSGYITTGITLGINLLTTNPLNFMDKTLALGTSVGASLIGRKLSKVGYDYVRNSLFANKEIEDIQEKASQMAFQFP